MGVPPHTHTPLVAGVTEVPAPGGKGLGSESLVMNPDLPISYPGYLEQVDQFL